jgi:hypothetical protein
MLNFIKSKSLLTLAAFSTLLLFNSVANAGTADSLIRIDITKDGNNLGVVVVPLTNIGGNQIDVRLQIKKDKGSFGDVRKEGEGPYEWGIKNASKPDNKLLNLANGNYELKAIIDTGSHAKKYTTKTTSISVGGSSGISNFQVKVGEVWKSVCCDGSNLKVSTGTCSWTEKDRFLTETTSGKKLYCPENGGKEADCSCGTKGEAMHGAPGGHVASSLSRADGAPIFPNIGRETCIKVLSKGDLYAKYSSVKDNKWSNSSGWPDKTCPHFRLTNHY